MSGAKAGTMAQSYYDILGVSKNASEKEIRAAYRRLARQHHPDVNPGNSEAADKFKKVNEAYHVLSDAKTRRDYDEFGDNWKHADQMRNMSGAGGTGAGSGSIFDIFGGGGGGTGGFSFSDLFGAGGGRGGFGTASVEGAVDITLEEAFHGTTRRVSLGLPSGSKSLEVKIPAGIPNGRKISLNPDGVHVSLTVNILPHHRFRRDGDNLHVDVEVPLYDAVLGGEVEVPTMTGKVLLKVPANTQNGRSFRMSGKGMPVLNSDRRGDLLATVKIRIPENLSDEETELFERLRSKRQVDAGRSKQ